MKSFLKFKISNLKFARKRGDLARRSFSVGGFSIIEVLIFTLLISIVIIGISYTTVFALRNGAFAQKKTQANAYAQQLQDWLRGQEEVSWETFVSSLSENTFCINSLPADISGLVQGACTDYSLNQHFKRELDIVDINAELTSVTYKITVSWRDGSNVNTVIINSVSAVPE